MQFSSMLWAGLGIGLLIFLHELGHFLAARLAGVRVEVFSLGFGPRLFGVDWRGTDFRVSLVPFGGYVMVAGQDPADRRYPARESLYAKGLGQRALFWSGGVLMNALFAMVVFPLAFFAGVPMIAPLVGSVDRGGAAFEAGLEAGDRILSVQGRPTRGFENLGTEIALHGQRPVELRVQRPDGSERTVTATPRFDTGDKVYVLGIGAPLQEVLVHVTPDGAAFAAGVRTGDRVLGLDGHDLIGGGLLEGLDAFARDDGSPLRLRIERDGVAQDLVLTPRLGAPTGAARLGVRQIERKVLGVRPGHRLVTALGLRRDDVLLAIGERAFVGGEWFPPGAAVDRVRLRIQRGSQVLDLDQPATAEDLASLPAAVALGPDRRLAFRPEPNGAAAAGGMLAGDRVVKIDGVPVADLAELRKLVEPAAGKTLTVTVQRLAAGPVQIDPTTGDLAMGPEVDLQLVPGPMPVADPGMDLEFVRREEEVRAESLGEAIRLGWSCSFDLVKQFLVTLKRLVTGDIGAKNLSGIIRISQISYHAAQRGPSWFWYFLAMLSANLAFVNLLPVPVLDGGHLLFLLIERIKGSPVSARVLGYSQVLGLVFVLLLVLFVSYNDILRLL